jgi:dGTPase
MPIDEIFRFRFWEKETLRPDDERDDYQRDKSRIIHSAAFRRLQAKTQVMGVGEGDFHRTRLTHSIETAQIAEGLLGCVARRYGDEIRAWLPTGDLLAAACYAHDLGHPAFGHGGEIALNEQMLAHGGFEGNAQTLRILTRLEKYRLHQGMNPTRRLLLAVLKYPARYSEFNADDYSEKPPKCYFDSEEPIVDWLLCAPFEAGEIERFRRDRDDKGKPLHRSFDCSLMECADDIAYGVHDLEDIVGRRFIQRNELHEKLGPIFAQFGPSIGHGEKAVSLEELDNSLFAQSHIRKQTIGKLVNLFVTSIKVYEKPGFVHPLLHYRVGFDDPIDALLKALKSLTYDLVVQRAEVQQLERRGQRIVKELFTELSAKPQKLIPTAAWESLDGGDSVHRRVCDYIAGMTDPYAERIYHRLFTPGVGSSRDEL